MTYKFESAGEWLVWKAKQINSDQFNREALVMLASVLDADTIQDLFESDMDTDGYFEEQTA